MSPPWRDPELLRTLYHEEGCSLRDIADKFGCTPRTVNVWMDKYGIETRPSPHDKPVYFGMTHQGYEGWVHTSNNTTQHVLVHRMLAVAEHGMESVAGRIVHHKNGIKWDNRIENIELMTQSEHATIHGDLEAANE